MMDLVYIFFFFQIFINILVCIFVFYFCGSAVPCVNVFFEHNKLYVIWLAGTIGQHDIMAARRKLINSNSTEKYVPHIHRWIRRTCAANTVGTGEKKRRERKKTACSNTEQMKRFSGLSRDLSAWMKKKQLSCQIWRTSSIPNPKIYSAQFVIPRSTCLCCHCGTHF